MATTQIFSNRSRFWVLFCLPLLAGACGAPEPTIPPADPSLVVRVEEYRRLGDEHQVTLAAVDEPGRRLVVLGRLVRREDGRPIPFQEIRVYHADESGSYDPAVSGDESTARLGGTVRSDAAGRFSISTILPGDYGSTENNRHIHTSVPGSDPEGYDFYFGQFLNRGLQRWAEGSDQAMILDLAEGPGGVLIATGDLRVKRHRSTR